MSSDLNIFYDFFLYKHSNYSPISKNGTVSITILFLQCALNFFSFMFNHIQKHKCHAVFKSRVKRQIFDMKMKRKLIQENRNSQKMVLIAKALHS